MASGPICLGWPRRAALALRLKKKRPARGAARSTRRLTTGKIMSCCSRLRLTTPAHCNEMAQEVFGSALTRIGVLLPAAGFELPRSFHGYVHFNSAAETIAFAREWRNRSC